MKSLSFFRQFHTTPKLHVRIFEKWNLYGPPFSWISNHEERENYIKVMQYYYYKFYDFDGIPNFQSTRNIAINFPGFENVPDLVYPYRTKFPTEIEKNTNFWSIGRLIRKVRISLLKSNYHISQMLKHMVETNEDDLKIATKQAFNIVMQAIAKKNIKLLKNCCAFNLDDFTSFAFEETLENEFHKFLQQYQTINNFEYKKIIESPEGFHQVTAKKIVKKVRYTDLINVISKLNLELNFTSDDVVFIPEDENGHILYSIRSEKNPNNDRQVRLLISIPIMALYKKKILYNSVRDRPLLGESDEVPTNSTTKHLLRLINYGYTRPLMAGAIITFAWPIDYKTKKKAGDAELFGFYVQLPQRKPYLRYI